MSVFNYRAQSKRNGKIVTGNIEAISESAAQMALEQNELTVISITRKREGAFYEKSINVFERVPYREVVIFLRQLAVMIEGGVPIVRALKLIADQERREYLAMIVQDVAEEVNSGVRLSKAMQKWPKVFDEFFVQMVKSGETTGKLDEVLTYLADQKEKDYSVVSRIKGAMIYPAFILVGLVAVGALMMVYVIPKLTEVLESSGQELPWATRTLIAVSNFSSANWWWIIILVIFGIVLLRWYYGTKPGKAQMDFWVTIIPIFGKIFQKIYLTRFAYSLSTLLKSGVPVTQALTITGDVVGNAFYKNIIEETRVAVSGGKSIATVFESNHHLPQVVSQMMRVGEETGRLDKILTKLGNFYEREVETLTQALINLIEPIIILLLGVAVAVFISAILLPIYNLSATV